MARPLLSETQGAGDAPCDLPSARLVYRLNTLDIGRATLGEDHARPHGPSDRQDIAVHRPGPPCLRKAAGIKMVRHVVGGVRVPFMGCLTFHYLVEAGGPPSTPPTTRVGSLARQSYCLARRQVEEDHRGFGPPPRRMRVASASGEATAVWGEPTQIHAEHCEGSEEPWQPLAQDRIKRHNLEMHRIGQETGPASTTRELYSAHEEFGELYTGIRRNSADSLAS